MAGKSGKARTGRDSYAASVAGSVGGHLVVGSNNVVHHTTIYQMADPGPGRAATVPKRIEPRPEQVVGRDDLLTDIHDRLVAGAGVAVVALSGLGGVGKTTTVVEYTHRHVDEYDLIWHVHAETVTGVLAQFHDLATALGIDAGVDPVAAVHAALATFARPWLLVLDNLTDHVAARHLIPADGTGHVLVSTQDGNWPPAQRVDVPVLGLEAGTNFLLDCAGTTERDMARSVAEALGLLPLALTQAGAYLRATGLSLSEYAGLLREQPAKLLDRGAPAAHQSPITSTWRLALTDLGRSSPDSVTLLRLLACMAPEDIPFRLLLDRPVDLAPEVGASIADRLAALWDGPLALADAMAGLRRHSLVGPPSQSVSVHRLVQAVTLGDLTVDERMQWSAAAGRIIGAAVPANTRVRGAWPVCAQLLPHAMVACDRTSGSMVPLADSFGHAGDYATACTVWAAIVEACTARWGVQHSQTIGSRERLARWTGHAGDPAAARDMYADLLPLRVKVSGAQHAATLGIRANLARWTGQAGDAGHARDMYAILIPLRREAAGGDYPSILIDRHELARWSGKAGDPVAARNQLAALLRETENTNGPEHPHTLSNRHELAYWTGCAGDAAGARDLFAALMPIRERVSGPHHPATEAARYQLAQWTRVAAGA